MQHTDADTPVGLPHPSACCSRRREETSLLVSSGGGVRDLTIAAASPNAPVCWPRVHAELAHALAPRHLDTRTGPPFDCGPDD